MYVFVNVCVRKCMCSCRYLCVGWVYNMYTYIHTHTHTYIHLRVELCVYLELLCTQLQITNIDKRFCMFACAHARIHEWLFIDTGACLNRWWKWLCALSAAMCGNYSPSICMYACMYVCAENYSPSVCLYVCAAVCGNCSPSICMYAFHLVVCMYACIIDMLSVFICHVYIYICMYVFVEDVW